MHSNNRLADVDVIKSNQEKLCGSQGGGRTGKGALIKRKFGLLSQHNSWSVDNDTIEKVTMPQALPQECVNRGRRWGGRHK